MMFSGFAVCLMVFVMCLWDSLLLIHYLWWDSLCVLGFAVCPEVRYMCLKSSLNMFRFVTSIQGFVICVQEFVLCV